jgi:hypothetical protein
MRAEVVSTDAYNRRWRATFGYAVAFAWAYLFFGIVTIVGYAVIRKPDQAGESSPPSAAWSRPRPCSGPWRSRSWA